MPKDKKPASILRLPKNTNPASILRLPEVLNEVGLSRSTVYKLIKDGRFPAPIKLGPRASGWIREELSEWIAGRISMRGSH